MRIIKFRGFHADEHGETVIKLDGKEIKGTWFYGDLHTDGPYINEHKVIPETVGQYVGTNDKHGDELYEYDVVRFTLRDEVVIGFIICLKSSFCVSCPKINDTFHLLNIMRLNREKIGNIFENPDLLEVEE